MHDVALSHTVCRAYFVSIRRTREHSAFELCVIACKSTRCSFLRHATRCKPFSITLLVACYQTLLPDEPILNEFTVIASSMLYCDCTAPVAYDASGSKFGQKRSKRGWHAVVCLREQNSVLLGAVTYGLSTEHSVLH